MREVSANAVVVLDVGGTTIAAAVIDGDEVVGEPVRGPSREADDAASIIDHFAAAVDRARDGRVVELAVVAVPAPFDYARGVSHMEHKFASLSGVELGPALRDRLGGVVIFVNDAEGASFGTWIELGRPDAPVATLTLGTGVGSGLVVGGEFAGHNEIWCWPYEGGIVENRVSSHALSESYLRRTERDRAVAEIGTLADDGDEDALATFDEFGRHLGAAAAAYFADAQPTIISCAGGITGAWRHVEPAASAAYRTAGGTGRIVGSKLPDPALVGGAELGRRFLANGA